jgi:hypothetical protein
MAFAGCQERRLKPGGSPEEGNHYQHSEIVTGTYFYTIGFAGQNITGKLIMAK